MILTVIMLDEEEFRLRYLPSLVDQSYNILKSSISEDDRSTLRDFCQDVENLLSNFENTPWRTEASRQFILQYYAYIAARYAGDDEFAKNLLVSMNLPDFKGVKNGIIAETNRLLSLWRN